MEPTAFISHASSDADVASRLAALLEAQGVRCWIAPRDVTPGQPYADEIVRGIEGCGAFVLVATAASLASRNVMNELEQAHRNARAIYTVMLNQPKVPGDVGYYIARLHWLQTDGTNLQGVATRLSEVMHGVRRWEAVASPPSLTRSLRNMLPAFGGAFAAIAVAVMLLGAVGWYWLQRSRHEAAADYRSLGWTSMEGEMRADGAAATATGRVWLGDADLPFAQTHLRVQVGDGPAEEVNLPPSGTGQAAFTFAVPAHATRVETLLTVPSAAESARFCVHQHFVLEDGTSVREQGEPRVMPLKAGDTCQ